MSDDRKKLIPEILPTPTATKRAWATTPRERVLRHMRYWKGIGAAAGSALVASCSSTTNIGDPIPMPVNCKMADVHTAVLPQATLLPDGTVQVSLGLRPGDWAFNAIPQINGIAHGQILSQSGDTSSFGSILRPDGSAAEIDFQIFLNCPSFGSTNFSTFLKVTIHLPTASDGGTADAGTSDAGMSPDGGGTPLTVDLEYAN